MQHVQATAALEHHSWRYRGSPTTLGELPRNSSTKGIKAAVPFLGGPSRGVSYPLSIDPCFSVKLGSRFEIEEKNGHPNI